MRTTTEIQAELDLTNAAIAKILGGGVQSFAHEGGDMATMLRLKELRDHRAELEKELRRATAGSQPRFVPATRF